MNLSIPNTIKQFSIEKKYYKKYFYKIVLKADAETLQPRIRNYRGWSTLRAARESLIRELAALPIDNADCKLRSEMNFVSVFTNDVRFIELIFDKLADKIVEYHSPVNEVHKTVMDENRRIRVRKNLFEKTFKYKVYFSVHWKMRIDKYADVKLWLDDLENTDNTRWAVNAILQRFFDNSPGHPGYTAAIYLNDPEDLMMCQIRFNSDIEYIEEAMLISSL